MFVVTSVFEYVFVKVRRRKRRKRTKDTPSFRKEKNSHQKFTFAEGKTS